MTILDGKLTDFTAGHITSAEGAGPDRIDSGGAWPAGDRVSTGRELSQSDDLSRPAGRRAVHRRDGHRPAARSSWCSRLPSHLPRGPGSELLKALMAAAPAIARRPPGQPGPDRGGKAAGECDLAVGAGQGAQRAEVCRASSPEGGDHLGRRSGAGRGSACRLDAHRRSRRDRLSRHRLRGQGPVRDPGACRPRHRLRARRGAGRGQP